MSEYPPHFKRPLYLDRGYADAIQALTGASTGTNVTNYGVTKITMASGTESATAGKIVFTLTAPRAGLNKRIFVQADSTKEIEVRTPSSGNTFYGSTFNALLFSTNGASTAGPPCVDLVGFSSVQWAVVTNLTTAAYGVIAQGATA